MDYYKLDHEATKKDLDRFEYPNKRIGVISIIKNEKGEILLQQRGSASQDAKFQYENIGGSVEEYDTNYKVAILREIKEEAGEEIELETSDSIGIFHYESIGYHWIFIIYEFKYLGGEPKIIEKNKCERYDFFEPKEAIESNKVSEGCKKLLKSIFR